MALFFFPDIESNLVNLPEEESRHIAKVLRLNEGDTIELTDGKGTLCHCIIKSIGKKIVTVLVKERIEAFEQRDYKLHIAIAPTKNIDRFEWFLEKATEIGIDEITPIITKNSERTKIRADRLEKVIIAAMKQSIKTTKPILNPICGIDNYFKANRSDYQLYIAYCGTIEKQLLKTTYQVNKNVVILIGPEGDFNEDEVNKAILEGYQPVSLGDSRLRTETAGIVACHSIQLLNQK